MTTATTISTTALIPLNSRKIYTATRRPSHNDIQGGSKIDFQTSRSHPRSRLCMSQRVANDNQTDEWRMTNEIKNNFFNYSNENRARDNVIRVNVAEALFVFHHYHFSYILINWNLRINSLRAIRRKTDYLNFFFHFTEMNFFFIYM